MFYAKLFKHFEQIIHLFDLAKQPGSYLLVYRPPSDDQKRFSISRLSNSVDSLVELDPVFRIINGACPDGSPASRKREAVSC